MTPRCAHTRGSGMWPLRGDVALWRAQPHGTGIWPLMGMRPHGVSVAIAWGCGPAMCPYPLHRDVLCSRGRLPSGQRFAELSPTRAHANPGAVCSRCLESLFNSQVHRQLGNGTGGGVRACVCVHHLLLQTAGAGAQRWAAGRVGAVLPQHGRVGSAAGEALRPAPSARSHAESRAPALGAETLFQAKAETHKMFDS